jgi:PAS domain S-box-containing protein
MFCSKHVVMSSLPIQILVVDDEAELCALTKEFLERSGNLNVDTARSVKEAVLALSEKRYDAIVSDYQMPVEDGIHFLKSLRSAGDRTPFILFTGRGREEVVIEALNNGADSYLQKGGEPRSQYAELGHRIGMLVQRHQAEAALLESETEFRTLFENNPDAVILLDLDGKIMNCNRAGSLFAQKDRQEMIGKTFSDLDMFSAEDLAHFQKELVGRAKGEAGSFTVSRFLRKDGSVMWVEGRSAVVMKGGKPSAFQIIARDITESKNAEDEMIDVQNQLKIAMDMAKLVYWEYDVDREMFTFNDQFYELYGSNQEQEGGCSMSSSIFADRFLPPEERGIVAEELGKCISTSDANYCGQATHTIIRVDGERRVINVRLGVIKNEAGRTVKVFGANQDITERKRSEEALARSEQMLHLVLDSIPQRIIWKDLDLNYIGCNKNAALSVGLTDPRELVGKNDFDIVRRDSALKYQADDRAVMDTGMSKIDFEENLQLMDGTERWLRTTKVPLRDSSGKVIGVMGSYEDITERKRAHQAMKKAMTAMENSIDGMAVLDAEGKYVFLNQAHASMYGYDSPSELLGKSWRVLYDSEELDHFDHRHMPILLKIGSWRGESTGLRRDGSKFMQEVSLTKLEDGGLICVVRDISEIARDKMALRKKTALFEAQVAASLDGILVIDQDLRRILVNQRIVDMFKVPPDIMTEEDDGPLLQHVVSLTKYPDQFLEKVRYLNEHVSEISHDEIEFKNGMVLDRYSAPVTGSDGTYYGRTWTFHEITEQKRTQASLLIANHKLNLLSSMTRHDINNQTEVLTGHLVLLKMAMPPLEDNDHLKKAENAAARISAMVRFTKTYEDIGVHAPAWCDVRRLVDASKAEVSLGAVEVVNDVPSGTMIFADPLVSKVFFNLIHNAIQHGRTTTTVHFTLEDRGGVQSIVCQDDGAGIADEMKEKLFMKGVGNDHGLGLFLCREILSITGISISEEGEPGKGARFVMTMP